MVSKKKLAAKKTTFKKAGKKPAKAKKKGKPKAKKTVKNAGFEAKSASLRSELKLTRQALAKNDSILSKKIREKIRLENSLNSILSKNFSTEQEILLALKASSARKQTRLRKELSSLEKINSVYSAKKERIDTAKKKQDALKKQLQLLEKRAGV